MSVCVIGCGMSGLLAAKAVKDFDPNIYLMILDKSENAISQQKGLHYLHDNCGLELKPYTVKNFVNVPTDSVESNNVLYSKKVWGSDNVLNNSLVNLPAKVEIYNFKEAFDILTKQFSKYVVECNFNLGMIKKLQSEYDMIISTIPMPILFPHISYGSEIVYIVDSLPLDMYEIKDFEVHYNLFPDVPWYRVSKIFGQEYTEIVGNFPRDNEFHFYKNFTPVKKIITQTEYDVKEVLQKYGILLAGRWGCWNRKKLVHHVYSDVLDALKIYNSNGVRSVLYDDNKK